MHRVLHYCSADSIFRSHTTIRVKLKFIVIVTGKWAAHPQLV